MPVDPSLGIEVPAERVAVRYDGVPRSRVTVDRRVQAAAEQAQRTGWVYPHCPWATAASTHAYNGVPGVPLQASMG